MVTSLEVGDILAAWTADEGGVVVVERLLRAISVARPRIDVEELAAALERRPGSIVRIIDEVCGRGGKRDRAAYMRGWRKGRRGKGGGGDDAGEG